MMNLLLIAYVFLSVAFTVLAFIYSTRKSLLIFLRDFAWAWGWPVFFPLWLAVVLFCGWRIRVIAEKEALAALEEEMNRGR